MTYYSIYQCIENQGTYKIKVGNTITGTITSENGIIYDHDTEEKFTEEDIWQIASFEEENNVEYIKID